MADSPAESALANVGLEGLLPRRTRDTLYAGILAKLTDQLAALGDRLKWLSAESCYGAERAHVIGQAAIVVRSLRWGRAEYVSALVRLLQTRPVDPDDGFGLALCSLALGAGESGLTDLPGAVRAALPAARAVLTEVDGGGPNG